MLTVKCQECQKEFEAKRSTAIFCSTNCRVKFNKKHKVITRNLSDYDINEELEKFAKKHSNDVSLFTEKKVFKPIKKINLSKKTNTSEIFDPLLLQNRIAELEKQLADLSERRSAISVRDVSYITPKTKLTTINSNEEITVVKVVNPASPRTKQLIEPQKGTNAYFLKYGKYD